MIYGDLKTVPSRSINDLVTKFNVFWPHFFREGRPQLFYGRLLARFTIHRLAMFGLVQFADLRLRSLAMKWNAEFTEGG